MFYPPGPAPKAIKCPRCKAMVTTCRLAPVNRWLCPVIEHWAPAKKAA